jgi:hypothetical protein
MVSKKLEIGREICLFIMTLKYSVTVKSPVMWKFLVICVHQCQRAQLCTQESERRALSAAGLGGIPWKEGDRDPFSMEGNPYMFINLKCNVTT